MDDEDFQPSRIIVTSRTEEQTMIVGALSDGGWVRFEFVDGGEFRIEVDRETGLCSWSCAWCKRSDKRRAREALSIAQVHLNHTEAERR